MYVNKMPISNTAKNQKQKIVAYQRYFFCLFLFYVFLFFFVFFLATSHALCDFSSQTRGWTWILDSESTESSPLDLQGIQVSSFKYHLSPNTLKLIYIRYYLSNCNVKIITEKETFFSHIFLSKISYFTLLYHVLSSVFKLVMSDKNKRLLEK